MYIDDTHDDSDLSGPDAPQIEDTAWVETDDGTLAFTDTDGDGEADMLAEIDENGSVVRTARLDPTTGEWVPQADSGMTVDSASGTTHVGPATEDTDGDGVPDTAIVDGPGGRTLLYTDVDHDGQADVVAQVTPDGAITVAEHTGHGDWRVTSTGKVGGDGRFHAEHTPADPAGDDSWADRAIESVEPELGGDTVGDQRIVRIDPVTGEWIS
ncbi:hypothetical protein D5S17_00715 [Pseudonocardiaceae bacterium YIM PH 21723]|nr:hypothetical protein D5S17_00715 [Pseudonocardiaceae bacterium YIM PH 21723]